MAVKRLTRKLTDVITEVEAQLKAHYGVTDKELAAWRTRAKALSFKFPVSKMIDIEDLWIDYEVQRDVIHKHIINIMKKWDPRICSPGSACRITGRDNIYLYDAQHRTIAAGILGFTEIPCAVVETDDPNFASYAFEMLNDTGVKRLTPGDLHRNALVRYKNGSRDKKVVQARTMQDQFDHAEIDLQDKKARDSASLCGDNEYFFSHFKYAQKGIEVDEKGAVLYDLLMAIRETFSRQEEIDQGVYIGLLELHKLAGAEASQLPYGWMNEVLEKVKKSFKSSHIVHDKAKRQWEHVNPGATWSAPSAMANFLREVYIRNGGKLNLPYHGEGSKMGIEEGNIARACLAIRIKTVLKESLEKFSAPVYGKTKRTPSTYRTVAERCSSHLARLVEEYRSTKNNQQLLREIRNDIDYYLRRYHEYCIKQRDNMGAHYHEIGADDTTDFEHLIPASRIRDLLLADAITVTQALNAPTVRLSRTKHASLKEAGWASHTPDMWLPFRRYSQVFSAKFETFDGKAIDPEAWTLQNHYDYFEHLVIL